MYTLSHLKMRVSGIYIIVIKVSYNGFPTIKDSSENIANLKTPHTTDFSSPRPGSELPLRTPFVDHRLHVFPGEMKDSLRR